MRLCLVLTIFLFTLGAAAQSGRVNLSNPDEPANAVPARQQPVVVKPRRRPAQACFGCGRASRPFVYFENGHDYCLTCAQVIFVELGLRPAGRREGDADSADLVVSAAQLRAGPRAYIAPGKSKSRVG